MNDVERLSPWMYEFTFPDGTRTPLLHEGLRQIHAVRRSMIFEFLEAVEFDRHATGLDLACSEGYFSFELAKRGARDVLGIDARPNNIEKAQLVRERLGLQACRFELGDVTEAEFGARSFDIVLLLGIVYHVEDPIRLIRRAAAATRRVLFLETQLTKPHPPIRFGWGSPTTIESPDAFAMLREDPATDELSSIRGFSLVPNASAIISILRDTGFRSILQLHPNDAVREPQYDLIDRAVFAALK
jgi:SAM-dependent methyltransferase